MRSINRLWITVIFFFSIISLNCEQSPNVLTDAEKVLIKQEIGQKINELNKYVNSHDVDQIMSFHLNSDDFTFTGTSQVFMGWDTLEAMCRETHKKESNAIIIFPEPVIFHILTPNIAVVTREFKVTNRPNEPDLDGALTDVFIKKENDWIILHAHESFEESK